MHGSVQQDGVCIVLLTIAAPLSHSCIKTGAAESQQSRASSRTAPPPLSPKISPSSLLFHTCYSPLLTMPRAHKYPTTSVPPDQPRNTANRIILLFLLCILICIKVRQGNASLISLSVRKKTLSLCHPKAHPFLDQIWLERERNMPLTALTFKCSPSLSLSLACSL